MEAIYLQLQIVILFKFISFILEKILQIIYSEVIKEKLKLSNGIQMTLVFTQEGMMGLFITGD